MIIIWFDESESDGVASDNPDRFDHTVAEIIISDRAHKNVDGLPCASPVNFTHSSDLLTMQEIFRVRMRQMCLIYLICSKTVLSRTR